MNFEPIANMKPGSLEPIYWNRTFQGYPESIWSLTNMFDIYYRTGNLIINDASAMSNESLLRYVITETAPDGAVLMCDATGNLSWVIPEINNSIILNE
jgi:hypothetical protein